MRIKCVALDLDRTTLNEEGKISVNNRIALEQAIMKGIHIIVASGRAFDTLPEEIKQFPGIKYAVTGNGAAMYDIESQECLHKNMLEEEDVLSIIRLTEGEPVTYEAFLDGVAYAGKEYIDNPAAFGASCQAVRYVKETRHREEDIVKFMVENRQRLDSIDIVVAEEAKKRELWERVKAGTKQVYITSSVQQLIELSHENSGKHSGVLYFMNRLGLRREEVAAFGDADNDIDMLHFAGCGIAMENATDGCRAAADYITRSYDEDGVAYGLREILSVI